MNPSTSAPLDPMLKAFMKRKLELGMQPNEVFDLLKNAGFSTTSMQQAYDEIRQQNPDLHQDVAAANNFLPMLKKDGVDVVKVPIQTQPYVPPMPPSIPEPMLPEIAPVTVPAPVSTPTPISEPIPVEPVPAPKVSMAQEHFEPAPVSEPVAISTPIQTPQPMPKRKVAPATPLLLEPPRSIFSGRINRRDFILGFLLLFGIGVVLLYAIVFVISLLYPNFVPLATKAFMADQYGYLLILTPLVLAPITIAILFVSARRLHDTGLPGVLAFSLLIYFVAPVPGIFDTYSILALQIMAGLLFTFMLVKEGDKGENHYGYKSVEISLFKRLFGHS